MDVSVIIVNYNTCQLLDNCLHSVFEQTKGLEFEVIVSDNQSVDGSAEMVSRKYPLVKWIQNTDNLGFGKANNVAVRQAKGRYVFLLNSDTILLNNAIGVFHSCMLADQGSIGVSGCWLQDANGQPAVSYGEFPSAKSDIQYILSRVFNRSAAMKKAEKEITEVDFVTGADMFIPAAVLEKTGLFDEQFFMYFEETDLQKRMKDLGYRRVLIEGPEIIHLEGGSLDRPQTLTFRRLKMNLESFRTYQRKHFHGMSFVWYRLISVLVRLTVLIDKRFSWKEKMEALKLLFK